MAVSATADKLEWQIPQRPGWELFPHDADIGVRGFGSTKETAFAEAARALTAAVADLDTVRPRKSVEVVCQAADSELLLVEWLNALVYEMSCRRMLFSRFAVRIDGNRLRAWAWGEPIDVVRHEPATEIKGATLTTLKVAQEPDGTWVAQCVVDI